MFYKHDTEEDGNTGPLVKQLTLLQLLFLVLILFFIRLSLSGENI